MDPTGRAAWRRIRSRLLRRWLVPPERGAALAVALAVAACAGPACREAARDPRPNILLWVGHGGPAGGAARPDAHSRVAARALRFARAYADDGETAASLRALLTGGSAAAEPAPAEGAPQHPTLAGVLADAGYRTAALVDRRALPRHAELLRDFDEVRRLPLPEGGATRPEILSMLDRTRSPWLLFVHAAAAPDGEPGPAALGRLLSQLRAHGADERTLVAVTSDHGAPTSSADTRSREGPYEERIRVELLLRPPRGVEPRTVTRPVSLRALAPSLLALAGIDPRELVTPEPRAPLLGDYLAGDPLRAPAPAVRSGLGSRRALVLERYKLIRDDADGRSELYDLAADPGERRDLAATRPDLLRRLERQLDDSARDALSPP